MIVYFIKPIGFSEPIKIGISKCLMARLRGLHLVSPFPLEVLATIDGGIEVEGRFHEKYLAHHRGYEWFSWTPELQADIEAINAGTFDINTLPVAQSRAPLQRGKPSYWSPERRQWVLDRVSA